MLASAFLLAACGGSSPASGPSPTPCPAASGPPDPGGGTTLRGFVFEGTGTDGAVSGRPVACATVVVTTQSGSRELVTDGRGFFDLGSTPSEFTLHVFPPESAQAAAVSVYDARTAATGQVLRVYLPLNRPAGSPARDPGGSLLPAVAGRLVDGAGHPQVGSYPAGGSPGDPGTTGFVWWGKAARQVSGNWVEAGITDSAGRFQVWTRLGGERVALTRPLFAGNYDGRRDGGDVLHYTAYAYLPAVDVLQSASTDVGTLTVQPVEAELAVRYDASAREVLAGWGPNGLGFTYLLSKPSVAGDRLEFGRAFTGPYRGGIATEQRVPAPRPLASGAPGTLVAACSFAFDATVTDGSGELSITEVVASGLPPSVTLSYLAPPRNFSRGRPPPGPSPGPPCWVPGATRCSCTTPRTVWCGWACGVPCRTAPPCPSLWRGAGTTRTCVPPTETGPPAGLPGRRLSGSGPGPPLRTPARRTRDRAALRG